MDNENETEFASKQATDYWNQVDVYVGGTEHAVGHLLYSRMWTKALYDLGFISFDEPFKKLVNQGMIQGSSRFVYRITLRADISELNSNELISNKFNSNKNIFISKSIFEKVKDNQELANQLLKSKFSELGIEGFEKLKNIEAALSVLHVDVNMVDGYELNIEEFKKWRNGEYANAEFILEDGKYMCGKRSGKA